MCSLCSMRYGSGPALIAQGFTTIVPAQEFVDDETYQDFMLYRCASESKFLDALRTIKIDNTTTLADKVDTAEAVRKLATYADNGEDVKKWGVDLKKLLGSIRLTEKEKNKVECTMAFSK